MRHFAVNLPAGVTMTKTRDVQHAVTFCHHWLHLWLMSISYRELCVGEDDKLTHTNTETKSSHRHSTSCPIRDQYFICSPPLLRCWLASHPEGTAHGHAHTHTLRHSEPLFALTDVLAVLCWHLVDTLSLSDAHHCLPTTLSKMRHVSGCMRLCTSVSLMLLVCHHYTLNSFYF